MSIERQQKKMKSMGIFLIFFVTELIFLIENTSSYFGMAKQFIKSYSSVLFLACFVFIELLIIIELPEIPFSF